MAGWRGRNIVHIIWIIYRRILIFQIGHAQKYEIHVNVLPSLWAYHKNILSREVSQAAVFKQVTIFVICAFLNRGICLLKDPFSLPDIR